jgi:hypothetical protein
MSFFFLRMVQAKRKRKKKLGFAPDINLMGGVFR